MRVKKQLLLTTILVALTGSLMVAGSFSWFAKTDRLITDDSENGIQGEIIKSYFHSGTGTKEDPLTITTRWHYENFIKLHYQVENFGEHSYYFQLGATENDGMPVGTTTPMFYAVDGNGVVQTDKTSNILNLQGEILPPLGTENKPFKAYLDGSGLTVENFTVGGNHYYDIGIFGFVDVPNDMNEVAPSIKNVYFNDFEIDTTAASDLLEHAETDIVKRPHYEEGEDNNASVGYIAGHITYSALCDNVYANNCTIGKTDVNDNNELAANEKYVDVKDNYGYFGKTEFDNGVGKGATGSNYSFTFDSSAVFNYMNKNYNTINSLPMRNRNTEYAGNYPNPEFADDNTTINPLKNGIAYVPKTLGMSSYNLIGDDPDDSYSGKNYSLSTLGYAPLTDESKSYRYKVVTEDGKTPPSDMIESTESLDTARAQKKTISENRRYYNSSTNQWEYYTIDTTDRPKVPITVNLSCDGSYTWDKTGLTEATDYWTSYSQAYLFVDGKIVKQYGIDYFETFTITSEEYRVVFTFYRNPTWTIKFFQSVPLELSMGTHHIGFLIKCCCGNGQYATEYFYDAGSTVSVGSGPSLSVTQGELKITQSTPNNQEFNLSINPAAQNGRLDLSRRVSNDNVSANGGTWNEDNRDIIYNSGCSTSSKILKGIDLNNPEDTTLYDLSSSGFHFEYDDGKVERKYSILHDSQGEIVYGDNGLPKGIDKDGIIVTPTSANQVKYENNVPIEISIVEQEHDSMWVATLETPKTISSHTIVDADSNGICDICQQPYTVGKTTHEDKPIFIADDPILTESGYSAENIDVVGGGFQFSQNFVTIDGEDNRNLTFKLTENDIGKKFYATEHAANSIVLYLSNVGGLNASDKMGDIKFHYSWTISGLIPGLDFKTMVFKKGGTQAQGGYVTMNENLAIEDGDYVDRSNDDTGLNRTIEMVLRRGIVKKCAYAALDRNGNILCGYDASGNQVGYTDEISERSIATYVLLVGVKNSIQTPFVSINTRITRIEFEYVAPSGFGGDFGSVEFRSASQTVDSTIFNFYFLIPQDDKYRVTVNYTGPDTPSSTNKGRYEVTFLYSSSSTTPLKVLFYLYDIENYEVYCNGEQVAINGSGEVNLTSSDPSTWIINNNS